MAESLHDRLTQFAYDYICGRVQTIEMCTGELAAGMEEIIQTLNTPVILTEQGYVFAKKTEQEGETSSISLQEGGEFTEFTQQNQELLLGALEGALDQSVQEDLDYFDYQQDDNEMEYNEMEYEKNKKLELIKNLGEDCLQAERMIELFGRKCDILCITYLEDCEFKDEINRRMYDLYKRCLKNYLGVTKRWWINSGRKVKMKSGVGWGGGGEIPLPLSLPFVG